MVDHVRTAWPAIVRKYHWGRVKNQTYNSNWNKHIVLVFCLNCFCYYKMFFYFNLWLDLFGFDSHFNQPMQRPLLRSKINNNVRRRPSDKDKSNWSRHITSHHNYIHIHIWGVRGCVYIKNIKAAFINIFTDLLSPFGGSFFFCFDFSCKINNWHDTTAHRWRKCPLQD